MEDYLKKIVEKSSIFLLLAYIAGFIGWNSYLSHFGFFEYDLLQTRFLSAGFLILLLPLIALSFDGKGRNKFFNFSIISQIVIFIIWVSFFSYFVFPYVPQYWGGAKPYVTSFITNAEISENFKLMGASLLEGNNKSIESLKSCKIYENKDVIIAGFVFTSSTTTPSYIEVQVQPNRVIIIDRSEIEAQSVLPSNLVNYTITCTTIRHIYGVDPLKDLSQQFSQIIKR